MFRHGAQLARNIAPGPGTDFPGEGIIPTMRHAHKKLLAETGVLEP